MDVSSDSIKGETTNENSGNDSSDETEHEETKAQQAERCKGDEGRQIQASRMKTEARAGSKKEIVLKLLRREGGATIAQIAKATDWQNHSIRGFLSAQVGKKMKLKVESVKSEAGGERTYRIVT